MTTAHGYYDMSLPARAARRAQARIPGAMPVPDHPDLLDEVLAVFGPLRPAYRPASRDPAYRLVPPPSPSPGVAGGAGIATNQPTPPSRAGTPEAVRPPAAAQPALFPTSGAPGMSGASATPAAPAAGGIAP